MGDLFAGRFDLLEPIASGGMGTVWLVRDHGAGPDATGEHPLRAAKILRQSDATSLLRFMREQAVRIEHPHVVTPLAWAGTDDKVLFTMPLVRGGSVTTLLADFGALPPAWVATLLEQTLAGLDAVHARGVVHRDVKPANLLLEPTGPGRPHLRLTDFGIAAPLDEPRLTQAWAAIGSPGYMAPEQLRGADPRPTQDLYAVGVVGLEMLGGGRPADWVGLGDPPALNLPTSLPAPVDDARRLVEVLTRAASQDPAARPRSAAAMRAEVLGLGLDLDSPAPSAEPVEVFDQYAEMLARHASPPPPDAPAPASAPRPPPAPARRVVPPAARPTAKRAGPTRRVPAAERAVTRDAQPSDPPGTAPAATPSAPGSTRTGSSPGAGRAVLLVAFGAACLLLAIVLAVTG